MPEGQVLEFAGVTKQFGGITAVSQFSARVEPGRVTGFLGPNGAGKTTTLRILLGLVRASSGSATIGGVPYAQLAEPLREVGAVLEASSFHPGRTATGHLQVYARAAGIPNSRVDDVLSLVGLADSAGRKVGGFSLGMRQRLGLATALLGDPGVLVLDEPSNGLDPEGIRWMRGFLRALAAEGRTVLVSSHMLAEVQQTVDALVIISRGRLVYQGDLEHLADPSEFATVIDAPDRAALTSALTAAGVTFDVLRSGLTVRGLDVVDAGRIAADAGIALSALQRKGPALEEVFLDLVNGVRVHASAAPTDATTAVAQPDAPAHADTPSAPADEPAQAGPADEPATRSEAPADEDAPTDVAPAPAAGPADAEPASAPDDAQPEPSTAAFSVASTGVIDVVPADAPDEDADPGEAAAAPVADGPPETGDAPDATPRPFDVYDKTESDLEADAFFGAFDGTRERADRDPDPDPEAKDGGDER